MSTAQIRVMQGSPDIGNVDVTLNGQSFASDLGWRGVAPKGTTRYSTLQAGAVHVQEFPTGATSPALVDVQFSSSANHFYTILTVGERTTNSLATLTLDDDHVPPASGSVRIRLVNGISSVGTVDIYITANSTDPVPGTPTMPAFKYTSASSYISLPGNSFELCVNPAGTVPFAMDRCLLSVHFTYLSPPTNSNTLVLLDPHLDPNAPPGNFTAPVVLASLAY